MRKNLAKEKKNLETLDILNVGPETSSPGSLKFKIVIILLQLL